MSLRNDLISGQRPTDWEDDVKMTVMFSPFRERSLNPKGWDQKLKFWGEIILKDCRQCKQSLISVSDLKEKFRRKGKMPACLQTVIQEMVNKGDLKKLTDMGPKTNDGWLSWGYKKLVQEPVGWSMKILPWQQTPTKPKDTDEVFVVIDVLKDKGQELLERHTSRVSDVHANIVEYTELQKQYADLCSSETEFSLVLQHLHDTKQVVIQEVDKNKKLVKFIHKEEEPNKKTIEEKDIHIHKIQLAKESLKEQIKVMETEVQSLGKEAVLYKAEGHKSLAMSSMRKRKLAQNRINKLTGSLDTLEEILYRIKQAESNEMVVRAIEGGTSILKGITAKTTAEEVAEIMDSLADVSHGQDELTLELGTKVGVDEPSLSDLEDELNDIMEDKSASQQPGLISSDDKQSHITNKYNKQSPITSLFGKQSGITSPDNKPSTSLEHDNEGSDVDEDLERELADILSADNTAKKDVKSDVSLLEMLDDLQLPDVPKHSPQERKPKTAQAFYS